ncbi:hypothetical protein BH20ACT2_BH20ACT2_01520 [soil metagenome]
MRADHQPGGSDPPTALDGVILTDALTGAPVDLGTGPPLAVLSAIRHRY